MAPTPIIPIIPLAVFAISLTLLGWGLYRARKLGKLGVLSWLQLLALLLPWLAYFGLFLSGAFISLAMLLLLLLGSTVAYILIGKQMRKIALTEKPQTPPPASPPLPNVVLKSGEESKANPPEPKSKIGEDLKAIQGIFGIETFYATETVPYMQGVVFRGNMRGEPNEVHQRLSASLSDRLGDKYELFLVEGQEKKPVVIVLPSNANQFVMTIQQKVLIVILVVSNIFTAMSLGGQLKEIDLSQNPGQYLVTLPFALGILLILACREFSLRWIARKYNVSLTWPSFLPSLQLGSFGAFSRICSSLPSRQVLFDIGIAPAITGGLLTIRVALKFRLKFSKPQSWSAVWQS
jgi:hypothetical protein